MTNVQTTPAATSDIGLMWSMYATLAPRELLPNLYEKCLRPEAGLRASDAFTQQRSQILPASSRRQRPAQTLRLLGCAS
jgi:hypothetical protein